MKMATQKRKLKLMSIVLAFVVLAVLVVTLLPLVVFATRTSKPAIHNAASTTQLQSSYSEPGWWRPCTHTYLNQATNHQVCDAWNQSWDLTKNPLPCDTTNYKDQTGVASTSLTNWRGIDVCGPRPNSSSAKDDNYVQFSKPDGSANKDSSVEQEFECTELVKRYLRLAYGLDAISANGGQLVGAYTAKHPDFFHSVNNDENVKIQMFPAEGDVLSFSYNHTAIVKSVSITNSISGNADIVIIEQNYSSSGIRPLKMTNWKIDGDNVSSWMTLRPVPAIPGGVWKSPTPADGSLQIPGTWVNVSAHAVDNSGQGLTKVYITESLEGTNNWGIVQPWYTSGVVGSADVSGSAFMPQIQNVLVSFDVYSNNGLQNLAPNGIRRFCP